VLHSLINKIIILLLTALFAFQSYAQNASLGVQKGILDLQKDFDSNRAIALDGEWEFYWHAFISTSDFDRISPKHWTDVPSRWRGSDWQGEKLSGMGYASYHLRVILPPDEKIERLALRITAASNAYSLFVNDRLIGTNGKVGISRESSIPQYRSQIYDFKVDTDTLAIVFHVSNFHYRSGGLWESIELGTFQVLQEKREKLLFFDLLLIGGIFMMGLYHLGIYAQRTEDKHNLYFAILCITVVLRVMSIGERLLTYYLPSFDWELLVKMEFISAMTALISLTYFFHWLFPKECPKWLARVILGVEFIFILIFLFLPASISSFTVPVHNYVTFGIIFANLVVAILAVARKRACALILALGFGVGSIFVINDILHNMEIVNTGNTVPLGMFVFFFSQALLLSSRSSKAFQKVISLSDELTEANQQLEDKIQARTIALKESNEELKQTVEELYSTLELAKNQKVEIENQHKNITSSINYAKRIQDAILPTFQQLKNALPNSFVIYKPKDIVSGDFYWFSEKYGKQIIIVADCTGHGIPGAFMSLLGSSVIYQLVNYQGVTSPEMILYELNNSIRKILKQDANSKMQEGMDIAICTIDKKSKTIEYAGAHRPLYYLQNKQVFEIKGDRLYIGGGQDERVFTKYTIDVSVPTSLYLFSDGYQDQYGEENKKKLGAKFFKEMLYEIHTKPIEIQEQILDERFEMWKGTGRQIDDVLVVGLVLSL
jgi:serine phosphatase RsbU (regulator of sigma subunit)